MRVLALVDGPVRPPDRWLWTYLRDQPDQVDFLHASPQDRFARWGKLLGYYPAYLALGLRALRQSRRLPYDLVVAWESKAGLPLAFWRALTGVREPPLLTLAFAYKGLATRAVAWGRWAARAMDHATVAAPAEVHYYARLLRLPEARFTCCLLGGYDPYAGALAERPGGDYIFAGGRSERDYATLVRAVAGLDARLIINARAFNVRGLQPPPHVQIRAFAPPAEFLATMAGARFVVVPLQDTPHAAGLSQVIDAMAGGRAVIATRTAHTPAYVQEGETGLLVPPYDADALHRAMAHLLAHPDQAERMGASARRAYERQYTFEAFARRSHQVMRRVAACGGGVS